MLNPFRVEYPKEIVTWKGRVSYYTLWHLYLMDVGRGQVLGKVTQVFADITAFMVVLKYFGLSDITLGQILLMSAIVGIVGVWVTGFIYVALGIDKVNHLVVGKRNPMMNLVYEHAQNTKRRKH